MIGIILKTLKIKHYIKNLVVFLPLIFSMNYTNSGLVLNSLLIFIAFCLISSVVYIMNDLIDIEKDKLHPIKSQRPITSGKISKKSAIIILVLLLLISSLISFRLNFLSFLMIISYLILNVFYSFLLKNIALIDVSCIAFGFIIRILGGCFSIYVIPSPLVILLTFFTSMFFTFSKRKLEYKLINNNVLCRNSIKEYTESLLTQYVTINAILSIAFYLTYMLDSTTIERAGTSYLYITVIPFTLIIFRLLLKIFTCENNDDPAEIIYKDKITLILILFYFITLFAILMVAKIHSSLQGALF